MRQAVPIRVLRGLKFLVRSRPAPANFKPVPARIWKILSAAARTLLTRTWPAPQALPKLHLSRKTTKNSCNVFHRQWQFIQWFISKPTEVFKKSTKYESETFFSAYVTFIESTCSNPHKAIFYPAPAPHQVQPAPARISPRVPAPVPQMRVPANGAG